MGTKEMDEHILEQLGFEPPEKTLAETEFGSEQQRLFAGKFYRQTGRLPKGEVISTFRVESQKYIMAGLEAQVEYAGADGKPFLKTIFTPIKRYMRDRNKYMPAEEDRKHGKDTEAARDAGETKEQSGAGPTSGS